MTNLRHSVFVKLLILFIVITLPILIIGITAIALSSKKLEKEIYQSVQASTNSFAAALDEEMEALSNSAYSIYSATKLDWYSLSDSLMSPYDREQNFNQIVTFITNLRNSNSCVRNIRVYISPRLRAANAEGAGMGSSSPISEEEFAHAASLLPGGNILQYEDGRLFWLQSKTPRDPDSIIEMELDETRLKRRILSAMTSPENYYAFFIQPGDFALSNIEDDGLMEAIRLNDMPDSSGRPVTVDISGKHYTVFYTYLDFLDCTYIQAVPYTRLMYQSQLSAVLTVIFLLTMFAGTLLFLSGVRFYVHKPLANLILAFSRVGLGDLNVRITETANTEFSRLYEEFNHMAARLNTLIEQGYRQKILLQKAEMKQLQAQINPHFLYNSFFMLQRTIQDDNQQEAEKIAGELGMYFRYITRNTKDTALLSQEYEHARIYCHIQQLRFAGRITITLKELPEAYAHLPVPKFILQPILENSFTHGLENKIADGLLMITFQDMGSRLVIQIEDNGEELTDDRLKKMQDMIERCGTDDSGQEITGILNVYKRLAFYSQNSGAFRLGRSELGGLLTEIILYS